MNRLTRLNPLALAERRLLPLGLLLFPVIAPFLFTSNRQLSLMSSAGTIAMLSYSLNLVFGYAGILSAAHGALWGVGAFSAAYANLHWGWGFWATLPFAAAMAALAGAAIGI